MKSIHIIVLSSVLLILSNVVFADLYIKIKNTDTTTTFTQLGVHAGIVDLAIKPCATYEQLAKKSDPSVEMVCEKNPDNTLFTHRVSRGKIGNGWGVVYMSFEKYPKMECASGEITFVDGVNVVSLVYPRDFKCSKGQKISSHG